MARHGVLSEFDNAKEEWQSYVERMEQYFSANDVTAAGKKRAILLSACGPATYQLIRNLVSPAATTDKSFAQIVELVQIHCHPKPSVIVRRYTFNSRSQKEEESLSTYIHRRVKETLK